MLFRSCRSEPPTAESVLNGLWSIQNDSLGGLTYPLTFVRDQPAERKACWFGFAVKDGIWVSPDGFKLHCLQG